jgi:oxygen-dependent protoporphyrinogen oxidase
LDPIAIIGGGISGLSAAYYLDKRGVPSTVIEKRPRLGGIIVTDRIEGCVVEGGPDSFLAAKPWAMELIRELGLESEVIGSNDHLRKTFVRRYGRMITLPVGVQSLMTSPLLSWGTKAKMALECFRRPPAEPLPDRSAADFMADHYGQEAVDYLAEPLLAGVYGGAPETLSATVLPRFVEFESKYGSISRGLLAERREATGSTFRTLKNGLGSLVDALRATANVMHEEVETIERTPAGYRLRMKSGDWMDVERVALACEAHASAALVRGIDPALAALLAKIPYTSSTVIAMVFEPQPLEGFGFLVPRKERRRIVACTYMGTKFPFRVPQNKFLIRCFLAEGGETGVLEELRELTGIKGDPLATRTYPWPQSMAQYLVGHHATISAIQARLGEISGLYLTGNAYYGVGIPDCIRGARQLAENVTISSNGPSDAKY